MKRSDMIESIVYICLSWDGLDTSGVPLEEIANDVLTHIERMGMLPPEFSYQKLPFAKLPSVKVNEWEPENE